MASTNGNETIAELRQVTKHFLFNPDNAVTLKSAVSNMFREPKTPRTFTALQNISFGIKRGEFLGILGKNGAGKSTLLKIMAKVLFPSEGSVIVKGRLAPLIELGAGFHPDLTGFENIFLKGSIVGLTKKEVQENVEKIIEFSELKEFINMPIRQYSSGMLLRLGFSVAVHISPDILLIDEVLAVGDRAYQEKCRERIHEMHQKGTTIVLVSHNREEIETHCQRCILIQKGRYTADGETSKVLRYYEALSEVASPLEVPV